MKLINLILTGVVPLAAAFDCHSGTFADFNFESLKGLHSISHVENTPPSVANLTWYINICGAIDNKQNDDLSSGCPDNSQICGIKYVLLPGSLPLKTEEISYSEKLTANLGVDKKYKNDRGEETTRLEFSLSGASWGSRSISSKINFICDDSVKDENDDSKNIKVNSWNNQELVLDWVSKSLCSKDTKQPNDDNNDNKDDGDHKDQEKKHGFGLFSLLFKLLLLVFLVYVFGAVWLTISRRGGSPLGFQETLSEVTEAILDVAKSAPGFIKEVFDKISGSASSRGGYSAV